MQKQRDGGGITRRMLVAGAGALTAGLKLPAAPQLVASSPGASVLSRGGKDRAFLVDETLRNVERNGQQGVQVKVRLPSYRSLPLSCIEGIRLKIDGEEFDPKDMVLTLNNHSHRLDELPRLSGVWWFILDFGDLFVPRATPLAPGEHDVEGMLITVEPYMTAGRFSFHSPCRKRLALEGEF
jgi:hypothetical protein